MAGAPSPGAVAAADLEPGYYPAVGWPEGTVVGWDGDRWHEPVTAPGYYQRPGGAVHWWNGRSWVPDIVAGRPPSARPAASRPPAGGGQRRNGPAHRRRRRGGWQARAAGAASAAVVAGTLLVARMH